MLSISFTRKCLRTSIQGRTYYKMKNDFHVADVMENISLFAFIDTLTYHARALTVVVYSAAISACFQILKNDPKIPSRFIIMCMLYYLAALRYMKHILTAFFVHQFLGGLYYMKNISFFQMNNRAGPSLQGTISKMIFASLTLIPWRFIPAIPDINPISLLGVWREQPGSCEITKESYICIYESLRRVLKIHN